VRFEVGTSLGVDCASLGQCLRFKGFINCQCLLFVPHFGMSAWHFKCTKHMGCNSDVQWRIYVWTEDRWAEGIRWEGESQAVVKIVMNSCVL